MKKRKYFVSNSSSSSFIIPLHKLRASQIDMIYNHPADKDERWSISTDEFYLEGKTWMDNFDMAEFLTEIVEVDPKIIKWGD